MVTLAGTDTEGSQICPFDPGGVFQYISPLHPNRELDTPEAKSILHYWTHRLGCTSLSTPSCDVQTLDQATCTNRYRGQEGPVRQLDHRRKESTLFRSSSSRQITAIRPRVEWQGCSKRGQVKRRRFIVNSAQKQHGETLGPTLGRSGEFPSIDFNEGVRYIIAFGPKGTTGRKLDLGPFHAKQDEQRATVSWTLDIQGRQKVHQSEKT